jgi:hypothetical protein
MGNTRRMRRALLVLAIWAGACSSSYDEQPSSSADAGNASPTDAGTPEGGAATSDG